MVMEFTIIPLARGDDRSAEILPTSFAFIEGSGLEYRMTVFDTRSKAMGNDAFDAARSRIKRVLTLIRVADYGERVTEIEGVVQRVEQELVKPCDRRRTPSP